VYWYDE
jgi:Thermophilic metalloprotease (M29)